MKANKVADKHLSQFESALALAIASIQKRVTNLVTKLETKQGVPVRSAANIAAVSALLPELDNALQQSGYLEAVGALQAGDADIIRTLRETSKIPLTFTKADANLITALQSMQNTEFRGIGFRAMEAVRKTVFDTIMNGVPLEKGLPLIEQSLSTNLQRYAWTYANTTRKDVMQQVIDLGVQDYEGDVYWEYQGPLDDVTREACIELLATQFFSDAEREEADAETAEERMYNCRHVFAPIPKSLYESK